jgi:hypothetical protein
MRVGDMESSKVNEQARIGQIKERLDPVIAAARGITVRVPLSVLASSHRDLLLLAELYRREGRHAVLRASVLVVYPPHLPPWWIRWALALRWWFVGRTLVEQVGLSHRHDDTGWPR